MAKEEVQKKWEALVAAFHISGEKATRWYKANQVDRRQLYTWMKNLGLSSPASVAVNQLLSYLSRLLLKRSQSCPPAFASGSALP